MIVTKNVTISLFHFLSDCERLSMVFMYRQVTHLIVFLVFNCGDNPSGYHSLLVIKGPQTHTLTRRIKILLIQKPLPNSSAGFRGIFVHACPTIELAQKDLTYFTQLKGHLL